jgi:microcystin-dependent protein
MADPFVAEIRVVGFNFNPKGWAFCDGALLPIAQNTALFSLIGTNYGGDGKSNFALPNLQGRSAISRGQDSYGTDYFVGEETGDEFVTLTQNEIPSHNHGARTAEDPATVQAPAPDRSMAPSTPGFAYKSTATGQVPLVQMSPVELAVAGDSQPHNNMPPYLTMTFIIALQGVFPPRP